MESDMNAKNTTPTRLIFVDRDRDIPAGTHYGPVIFDHFVLECCVSGGGEIRLGNHTHDVGVGMGYVLFPGSNTELFSDPVTSRACIWCALVGDDVENAITTAGITPENPFIPPAAFSEVKASISDLYKMRDESDGGAEYRRMANIYRILGALLRESSNQSASIYVDKAIGIMETKYNQPLTVAGVASLVGLDRAYFTTLFTSKTGSSPYTYLTKLRVKKACALLLTDMPVSAVADAVGIPPQNFSRIFRRIVGITPREYASRNN